MNKPLELTEFIVPQSNDTEILLVAELISRPDLILDVRKLVHHRAFGNKEARKAYEVLLTKYENHEAIDMTTMWDACDKKFFTEQVIPYTLRQGTAEGILEHARIVKELYLKRMAYFSALKTLQMIKDGSDSASLMGQAKSLQEDMVGEMREEGVKTLTQAINELADDVQNGTTTKIATGIRWLDYYTYGGFGGGELVILAARPSVGKTAVALQIANEMARQSKYTVMFSLEMTNAALAKRSLLSTGMVKPLDFYRDTDWKAMEMATKQAESDYLLLDDESCTLEEITAKIESLHREGKCDAAMIDYLQLMKITNSTGSLNRDLGVITSTLKRLAKRLNIPIVLLSQLNRSSASEGRSPQLYDLRDSGSIESDADMVIMLDKPQDFNPEEDLPKIELWLRKNRENKRDISVVLTGTETYSNFQE